MGIFGKSKTYEAKEQGGKFVVLKNGKIERDDFLSLNSAKNYANQANAEEK